MGRFTKTPYLVLFVVLGAIGVSSATAVMMVTVAGNFTVTGDTTLQGDAHVAAGKSLFVDTIEPESESFVLVPGGLEVLGFSGFGNHLSILKSSILCIDDGATGTPFDCLSGAMIIPETVTSNEIQDGSIAVADISNAVPIKTIPQHPRINQISTVDSGGDVGEYTSITIGTNGLPIISYYDKTNDALKVANCSDPTCTSSFKVNIDPAGNLGRHTSITIGADGLPIISYQTSDITINKLKVAHCNNVFCTSRDITTVDTGNVGSYTSITIGTDGLPIISYYDIGNGDLKVIHCRNASCSAFNAPQPLDTAGDVGTFTSIIIGTDGLPIISYLDVDNADLKVAHCNDVTCTSAALNQIDTLNSNGAYSSITIGADGLPIISYYDETFNDLKVAHCNDVTCTSAAISSIDTFNNVGLHTSITIGSDGLPIISYSYEPFIIADLKVARCHDVTCASASTFTIDSGGDIGDYTSITIGTNGLPIISYYDETNKDLKVIHCGNEFCIPNWTRR